MNNAPREIGNHAREEFFYDHVHKVKRRNLKVKIKLYLHSQLSHEL